MHRSNSIVCFHCGTYTSLGICLLAYTNLLQLCVELEGVAHLTSCDTIIEYIERFKTLQVVVFSFLTSINERSNGHLNEQQSNAAYLGLQSVLQLVDLNNVVADHATVITIVISP